MDKTLVCKDPERKIARVSLAIKERHEHEKKSHMSYSRMAEGGQPIFKHKAQVKVVTMTNTHQGGLRRISESLKASGRPFSAYA